MVIILIHAKQAFLANITLPNNQIPLSPIPNVLKWKTVKRTFHLNSKTNNLLNKVNFLKHITREYGRKIRKLHVAPLWKRVLRRPVTQDSVLVDSIEDLIKHTSEGISGPFDQITPTP